LCLLGEKLFDNDYAFAHHNTGFIETQREVFLPYIWCLNMLGCRKFPQCTKANITKPDCSEPKPTAAKQRPPTKSPCREKTEQNMTKLTDPISNVCTMNTE
jgi:hypothetical protein